MNRVYRSRLSIGAEEKAARFRTSVKEDEKIFEEDIDGTEAHNIMLYEQRVITKEDLVKILSALEKLRLEKRKGRVKLHPKYEDVHEFIEEYVIKEVGLEVGGKLHTGRSRNDQVALDIRMRLRSDLNEVSRLLLALIEAFLTRAEEHKGSPMMLYTHTQHAQIGSFPHFLMAYVDFLFRDLQRLQDCYVRVNLSPLGAGPIGGTRIDIHRERTADLLGFNGIVENSIDATSSRDFMVEVASVLAILMSGLSRISEDLILWSSSEFGYVELDDKYASVSSIMPQKKNPDILELIRGKTGNVFGNLLGLLTIIKGLSTGYSTDLQETKSPLWDSINAVKTSLEILEDVVRTLNVNTEHIAGVLSESYAFAIDFAENLTVKTSLSFREAHMVVGNLVREMLSLGIKPRDLKSKNIEIVAEKILGKKLLVDDALIRDSTDPDRILQERKPLGSPSGREVERMLKARKKKLKEYEAKVETKIEKLNQSRSRLMENVKRYA